MQVVVQNMLGLVGIRLASVPRRMADKDVTLRWYRFTDLPRLHALVTTEVLRQVHGTIDTDIPSFSAFCVWMLTTFP